jgi:hypothetical protein
MRKRIIPLEESVESDAIDVHSLATVSVTSEDGAHPIDLAFDGRRGPGATHWLAEQTGPQKVIIAFDHPQTIRKVVVETEERDASRTQEITLSISKDGGRTYRDLRRQEFNFSPDGSTWEREDWTLAEEAVTHVQLAIKPDKGGRPFRAALTTFAVS